MCTFDFLELFTEEVLAQLIKEAEKRDWVAVYHFCCMPDVQATLGSQLAETPFTGSCGDMVCLVPMASHMGWADRDPRVISHIWQVVKNYLYAALTSLAASCSHELILFEIYFSMKIKYL